MRARRSFPIRCITSTFLSTINFTGMLTRIRDVPSTSSQINFVCQFIMLDTNKSDTQEIDSGPHGGSGPFSAALLEAKGSESGVVLMHGRNSHPDGPVVGFMRKRLHQRGYTTLSLANPLPPSGDEFADYVKDLENGNFVFREASARLKAALHLLRKLPSVYLLGFSMGSRLMASFLAGADRGQKDIRGFVALSIGVNGPGPLSALNTLGSVSVPVLEICGEADTDVAKSASERRTVYEKSGGPSYTQFILPGKVPHNFAGSEELVLHQVLTWLADW